MPLELKETRLPGVGVKWTMTPAGGSRVTIIQHNDGDREVYVHRRARDEEPAVVLELHDDEARQLGALLGGAYERPKIVEELEMALGEFQIEWIRVPSGELGQRADAGRLRVQEAHRRHGDRDPAGVRVDRRRAAGRRDPRRGHDRRGRQGRPVQHRPCPALGRAGGRGVRAARRASSRASAAPGRAAPRGGRPTSGAPSRASTCR